MAFEEHEEKLHKIQQQESVSHLSFLSAIEEIIIIVLFQLPKMGFSEQ